MNDSVGFSPQDDQVRYLQDASNNVKRAGYHMQQAMVGIPPRQTMGI